ncbi:MAG: hypothetical protein EA397_00270 [Deltaproteobacteria bacterium]|nr:MAG: hypothetical protein EA397_00270 [Deltaproteobacteria bacterium]
MTPLWVLAVALGQSEPEPEPQNEPSYVLALGQRGIASLTTSGRAPRHFDTTTHISLEVPLDPRTSLRFEVGYFPVRERVHLAGVARGYPLGRRTVSGFMEVGVHAQHTGPQYDAQDWTPEPASVWISAPVFLSGGARASNDRFVAEVAAGAGTLLMIHPSTFAINVGLSLTASAQVGVRF